MRLKAAMRTLAMLGIVAMVLTGCYNRSPLMAGVAGGATGIAPTASTAVIVFMRPSNYGATAQATVFDITGDDPVLVGIVSADTKIAYKMNPGTHRFMVVAESADFMDAEVEAGKTYYSLVDARLGVAVARFSLRPVQRHEIDSARFQDWFADCAWVQSTDEAREWAERTIPQIRQLRAEYLPGWLNKASRPRLYPTDGV